ncbi:MAG: glycosyltransferase [Bacteroidia bacterium]|nr:glycosyltransferase [Bacteroidia bacterium]
MKTLVLITSAFPFGSGESFIETEFPFLHKAFDRIIIIARNVSGSQTRELPDDVTVLRYNVTTTLPEFFRLPVLLFKNISMMNGIIDKENTFRKNLDRQLDLRQKIFLIRKLIKAFQFREFIDSKIHSLGISSDIIFYSYWLTTSAHAIGLLDYKRSIKISRAHGSDLYEEKSPTGYLPLLKFVSERLDSVFFVSENGKNYFREKTGADESKMAVSRLGISSPEIHIAKEPDAELFTVVSCSSLIPIKRVGLIISALGCIESAGKIKWIHFGDGHLKSVLEKQASAALGKKENVLYEFRGEVPNKDLLEFYGNNRVDLFINTSLTEGLPVSIMEAQAIGIPAIATDTGGVGEIVSDETGCLLPVNSTPRDIASRIDFFMRLRTEERAALRERIIMAKKRKFEADENYPDFIKKVNRIFDLSINHSLTEE